MKHLLSLSLTLQSLVCFDAAAVIFGQDDRVDTILASAEIQELARSVPTLIQKHRIQSLGNGQFKLTGTPLKKMNVCSTEAFADEANISNCSASFIGKDKILTAAHCLDEKTYACDTYSVVFDYQQHAIPMKTDHVLENDQIYHCKSVVYRKFDETMQTEDLAIIQLDREVKGREPIKLVTKPKFKKGDLLTMIGYPMGISQKVVEDGRVISTDSKNISFKHDLDTFSVNSGSPIFLKNGRQIGVLVRGTGPNFQELENQSCSIWGLDNGKDYAEANDLSTLDKLPLILK